MDICVLDGRYAYPAYVRSTQGMYPPSFRSSSTLFRPRRSGLQLTRRGAILQPPVYQVVARQIRNAGLGPGIRVSDTHPEQSRRITHRSDAVGLVVNMSWRLRRGADPPGGWREKESAVPQLRGLLKPELERLRPSSRA